MKILATSDIHGNKALVHLICRVCENDNIDALIIAGDISPKGFYKLYDHGLSYGFYSPFGLRNRRVVLNGTLQQVKAKLDLLGYIEAPHSGYDLSVLRSKQKEQLAQICALLKTMDIPVYMLIGNDDHICDEDWDCIIEDYGFLNLNLRTYPLEEFKVTGFQYVPPTPWNTNNELSEEQLAQRLRWIEDRVDTNTILITHGPPRGILDTVTNGLHAGSQSIFDLVKAKQPVFHLFGHIHEAFGNAMIDNTICCNTSCLWTDWLLRGYIIDTEKKAIKRIKEEVPLREISVLSCMNGDAGYVC